MRGMNCSPMPAPEKRCSTRTQVLVVLVSGPCARLWKCSRTRMRPSASVWISSAPLATLAPSGPTTVAVCAPGASGLGFRRAPVSSASRGRQGTTARVALKALP